MAVESGHKHLERVRQHLLKHVEQYRKGLVDSKTKNGSSVLPEEMVERIQDLTCQAEKFSNKLLSDFSVPDKQYSEPTESLKDQATQYNRDLKLLFNQVRTETFGNKFMNFKANHLFTLGLNTLGVFEYCEEDFEMISSSKLESGKYISLEIIKHITDT